MASTNEFQEAVERAKRIAKVLAEQGSKRGASEEDGGGEPPSKRGFSGFPNGATGIPGMNGNIGGPNQQSQEEWSVPNRMVGLIIGKGGENIGRIQDTCGAKLQLGQEATGEKRSCIIYGTPIAIQKCKEMVGEIIDKEGQRGLFGPGVGGPGLGGPGVGGPGLPYPGGGLGGAPQAPQMTVEVHVPKHKVGQIIGKGGETIRSLQDKARVRMFLIQDVDPASPTKPIKITGDPERVEHARQLVEEMIAQPDGPPDRGGQVQEQLRVPRGCVGVIIGKGGETIRDIQNETGARIQFIDNPQDNEKTCLISGRPPQVQEAKRMVEGLLANSAQMQMQKQGPPLNQPRYECEEVYKVPAARTGVVIGKGGETIRMICERSGAKVELDRNHPQTADDRLFHIRGSRECVELAKRMIEDKIADQPPRGNFGGDNRPGGNWDGGAAAPGYGWEGNAAGAGDPASAFWSAYCQQYYQMMGGAAHAQVVPGMAAPYNVAASGPDGSSQAVGDPNAASYYYSAAANPQAENVPVTGTVQTTEDGQQDFSRAWVDYYRSVGQHKEADDLEASLKAKETNNGSQ